MVAFAGYHMPVHYRSILAEHRHTRADGSCSLFDISHMGWVCLPFSAAGQVEKLAPGGVCDLASGGMIYTQLTNAQGGILDDLIALRLEDSLILIVNGACKDEDFAYLCQNLAQDTKPKMEAGRVLLALQGSGASQIMAKIAPGAEKLFFMQGASFSIAGLEQADCVIMRSGYTGEDGFEISLKHAYGLKLAQMLLAHTQIQMAGLGARDSLRLEAGLCLYGQDLDRETTPVEAALSWSIPPRRRLEGGFCGAEVILRQLQERPLRRRVGILPNGRNLARLGCIIYDQQEQPIGKVTSGAFGASFDGPIAMGYVVRAQAKIGTKIGLGIRNKIVAAEIVKLPFVAHRYFTANKQ